MSTRPQQQSTASLFSPLPFSVFYDEDAQRRGAPRQSNQRQITEAFFVLSSVAASYFTRFIRLLRLRKFFKVLAARGSPFPTSNLNEEMKTTSHLSAMNYGVSDKISFSV